MITGHILPAVNTRINLENKYMSRKQLEKEIKELEDDIKMEQMQYDIGVEHPTYTEQFRRGQANTLNRIQGMKEKLRGLTKKSWH